MHTYMYTHIYIHTQIYIYIYAHMYTNTYISIYGVWNKEREVAPVWLWVMVGPIIFFPKFIDVTVMQEAAASDQGAMCNGDYEASASETQMLNLNLFTRSFHLHSGSGWRFWRASRWPDSWLSCAISLTFTLRAFQVWNITMSSG